MKGASVDTRFLVELFYSSDKYVQRKIRDTLLASRPNFLSSAALSELYLLTPEKEGKDVAKVRANSLAKDFRLVGVDREVAVQAATIKHRRGVPLADSPIASIAKVLGVPCCNGDPHLRSVAGLIVEWLR